MVSRKIAMKLEEESRTTFSLYILHFAGFLPGPLRGSCKKSGYIFNRLFRFYLEVKFTFLSKEDASGEAK